MNILESFPKVRVLIIGDVMLDRYWWGDVNRISPEAPVPIVRLRGNSTAPGGAANVATNVIGLGAIPILLGAVGDDTEAQELSAALNAIGVASSDLIRLGHRSTIVKTRIVAHGQQVVRVDREERFVLTNDEEARILASLDQAISRVDIVIVSDYGKGVLNNRILQTLIAEAASAGLEVLIDPKGNNYAKYRGASLLTPNRREAADACGLTDDDDDVVTTAGTMLLETAEAANVLVTQSEQGMTLFSAGHEPRHIPATAQETYDVTGAGDTVIATVGVAHAAGFDLFESAQIANVAAGEVVQQIGTTAISLEHLQSALSNI